LRKICKKKICAPKLQFFFAHSFEIPILNVLAQGSAAEPTTLAIRRRRPTSATAHCALAGSAWARPAVSPPHCFCIYTHTAPGRLQRQTAPQHLSLTGRLH